MSVAVKRSQEPGIDPTKRSRSQPTQFEEDLTRLHSEKSHAADQIWARPDPPSDFASRDIVFQQIDAEEAIVNGQSVVRLFGVTDAGNSIMCDITGFLHYFYLPVPILRDGASEPFTDQDVSEFASVLSEQFPGLAKIEIVMKQGLWGYRSDHKSPFFKIFGRDPAAVTRMRGAFERSAVQFKNYEFGTTTYDNISYELRCTIDCHITGMSWITLPASKYRVVPEEERKSRAQLEVRVPYNDVISHPPDGDYLKSAPIRILSFDIECAGRKGIFPDASIDPVIQIANMVQVQGESTPFVRNVFTVGTCSKIVGTQVLEHDREEDMLMNWSKFINEVDPDVIIGYNTANFDFPYLINRAEALKLHDFPYFGRLKTKRNEVSVEKFSSKAYGNLENKVTNTDGRIQIDMLQYIRREYKLRSYSLNAVSAKFLEEQKEDVHHSIITELQNGNAESRHRLAVYCLKDAYLPLRLMDKLMTLVNMTEMARVTGVPISYLLSRGQQIKVVSQLFRKALEVGMVVPNMKQEGSSDEQYEGATVIEPVRGYYSMPIATLDFSSLYPSIMMAHNLCYTTLLDDRSTIDRLNLKEGEDYIKTPTGDMFVTNKIRRGLLPIILNELITARKRAKADLKKETDPFRRAVLDGRQLALKISANSVYGFTGATIGKLPCLAISSSVTAFGRDMIEHTKNMVEEHYTKKNGYDHDAQVIYGDTDSVMVKFGPEELDKCMSLGQEAAELVSQTFVSPIKLEFEKVYFPYLLINKKRYAGLYWTRTDKYDKMDTKGIETVRRDNCQLVQNVIETALNRILIDRDVKGAEAYVKGVISDLLQNRIDLSQLVITKALSKDNYDDGDKQAHVALAKRMRARDPGSAPALGDRVAYVIIRGAAGMKNYQKSEDPIYVLENNIPIDTEYYLTNQLSKPLLRIFEPILGDRANQLLTGSHTRTISKVTPTTGGLMKFAVKTELCKGCKRPLRGKYAKGAVCENCVDRVPELYLHTLSDLNGAQEKFARLWTQCQRCQGSLHQDVICSSKDCPIFFMRRKAQKEVESSETEIAKFDRTDW